MKNLLKKMTASLLSVLMVVSMMMTGGINSVSADNDIAVNYNFQEITDASKLTSGEEVLMIFNKELTSEDAIIGTPDGSAYVEILDATTTTSDNYFVDKDGNKLGQKGVKKISAGAGFDTCGSGDIAYINDSVIIDANTAGKNIKYGIVKRTQDELTGVYTYEVLHDNFYASYYKGFSDFYDTYYDINQEETYTWTSPQNRDVNIDVTMIDDDYDGNIEKYEMFLATIGYTIVNSNDAKSWRYACSGNGVSYVGPYHIYTYDTAYVDSSAITGTIKDGYIFSYRTLKPIAKKYIDLEVTYNDKTGAQKTASIPSYRISSSNATLGYNAETMQQDHDITCTVGSVDVNIYTKGRQAPPSLSAFYVTGPATEEDTTGTIAGLNTDTMQFFDTELTDDDNPNGTWVDVENESMTLPIGTYKFRYKETTLSATDSYVTSGLAAEGAVYNVASEATDVTIKAYQAPIDEGDVYGKKPEGNADKGTLNGLSSKMQYRGKGTTTWYDVPEGATKVELYPGIYEVRYAETDRLAASASIDVVVPGTRNAPDADLFTTTGASLNQNDGIIDGLTNKMEYCLKGTDDWKDPTKVTNAVKVGETYKVYVASGEYEIRYQKLTYNNETVYEASDSTNVIVKNKQSRIPDESTISTTAVSAKGATDGTIKGLTYEMEYKKVGSDSWKKATSGSLNKSTKTFTATEGAGKYEVRYVATETLEASDSIYKVIIDQADEINLTGVSTTPSTTRDGNGTIKGLNSNIQYRKVGTSTWKNATSGTQDGTTYTVSVAPGEYEFRNKEISDEELGVISYASKNPSETTFTVKNCRVAVTGLEVVAPTYTDDVSVAGQLNGLTDDMEYSTDNGATYNKVSEKHDDLTYDSTSKTYTLVNDNTDSDLTVKVRRIETANEVAGESVTKTIAKKLSDLRTLDTEKENWEYIGRQEDSENGQLKGLNPANSYQYKLVDEEDWSDPVTGVEELDLRPGTYHIRYAATDTEAAGIPTTFTIKDYGDNVTGLYGAAYSDTQSKLYGVSADMQFIQNDDELSDEELDADDTNVWTSIDENNLLHDDNGDYVLVDVNHYYSVRKVENDTQLTGESTTLYIKKANLNTVNAADAEQVDNSTASIQYDLPNTVEIRKTSNDEETFVPIAAYKIDASGNQTNYALLTPGTYEVRYAATDDEYASEITSFKVVGNNVNNPTYKIIPAPLTDEDGEAVVGYGYVSGLTEDVEFYYDSKWQSVKDIENATYNSNTKTYTVQVLPGEYQIRYAATELLKASTPIDLYVTVEAPTLGTTPATNQSTEDGVIYGVSNNMYIREVVGDYTSEWEEVNSVDGKLYVGYGTYQLASEILMSYGYVDTDIATVVVGTKGTQIYANYKEADTTEKGKFYYATNETIDNTQGKYSLNNGAILFKGDAGLVGSSESYSHLYSFDMVDREEDVINVNVTNSQSIHVDNSYTVAVNNVTCKNGKYTMWTMSGNSIENVQWYIGNNVVSNNKSYTAKASSTGTIQLRAVVSELGEATTNVNVLNHNYVASTEKHDSTCTAEGWYQVTHTCSCGDSYKDAKVTIAKKAHTFVTDYGYAATGSSTGLTNGSHCSVCGYVNAAQQTIAVIPNAVGYTYTTGTTECRIITNTDASRTVAYKNKQSKTKYQTIGSTVTLNGQTFTVTALKRDAVNGTYVKTLTLASSITTWEAGAFNGDNKLTKINVKSTTLNVESGAFAKMKASAKRKLKVYVTKKMGKKAFNALKAQLVREGLKASNIRRM